MHDFHSRLFVDVECYQKKINKSHLIVSLVSAFVKNNDFIFNSSQVAATNV